MSRFRMISTKYWSDSKVVDDFSKNEKYLFLYLLTGPGTNLCGCYEISMRQISFDTELSIAEAEETISLLAAHDVIRYSGETKELLVLNWAKYNWSKSSGDKMRVSLRDEISAVKNESFRAYLTAEFCGADPGPEFFDAENNVPPAAGTSDDASCACSESGSGSEEPEEKDLTEKAKDIVAYLNGRCGTHYRDNAEGTLRRIRARLKEFTVEDCRTVIDKKAASWGNDEKMRRYLRPETLFGPKFESYLNEPDSKNCAQSGRQASIERLAREISDEDQKTG